MRITNFMRSVNQHVSGDIVSSWVIHLHGNSSVWPITIYEIIIESPSKYAEGRGVLGSR